VATVFLQPDPWTVDERLARRRLAAERYRALRPVRRDAAARRRQRVSDVRRSVGFGLVEMGLKLLAPAHRRAAVSSSLRRSL
jgi:hypothetical protein